MHGAIVYEPWSEYGFTFKIYVNRARNPNGPSQCFGVVTVQELDSSFYPRRFAMVSEYDRINLSNNNMNNSIFDGMNDALTEFK
jgi:hypothetical protein